MRWFDRALGFLDDDDPGNARPRLRAFEITLVILSVTEFWARGLEIQAFEHAFPWPLPVVGTLSGMLACTVAWRRVGMLLLALSTAAAVWEAFPIAGNHRYLMVFLCALFALLDVSQRDEQVLLLRSLRWVTCVIVFFAGIQKLVHGYYTNGLMLAYLLVEPRFEQVFGMLLPVGEAQRLHSYNGLDGAGPYFVAAPMLLVASNLVWVFEIVLAAGLAVRRLRPLLVGAGVAFVVLIEAGARELVFGLLFVNLLLIFLRSDINRRLIPIAAVTCVLVILAHLGVLPVELH